MKKTLLASSIAALALSSSVSVHAESFDDIVKGSSVDLNFRFRTESADLDNAKDAALANTLKSRLTFKSGEYAGVSVVIEGDNVFHITDDFDDKENGNTEYNVVLDQETTQFNQAYAQYNGFDSTVKLGNQRILLDNQRHVGGVGFRQDEATFDAVSIKNTSIENLIIFAAIANNRNFITNANTEESISLLNAKYKVSDDLAATAYYYGIDDVYNAATGATNTGVDLDTFGIRAVGKASGFGYEAELATQNKTTAAGGDFSSLYYHIAGSKKIADIKATIGIETFGSDDGAAAFGTPLGTNHKFYGWSDTFLTGAGNNGIQNLYASAVTKVSGVKLVGQYHNFTSVEGSDPLGNEFGFVAAKKFGQYGASLKVAHYIASDFAENLAKPKVDTTKVWLTATAKF
ncbi:hypothetical protein NBRC116188_18090 [Oceaniserpentilla sp. 4NH20-0058]|uniref:hypothetical protein n=1 Tax=Oceaniserpentilla sp. 4NH20-0058 TaxID=3127660 RepID=UPI00310A2858